MAGNVYDTSTLLEVQRHTKTLTPFWLTFFPSQINFETQEIFFDKVDRDYRRLAPLVAPNVQGRAGKILRPARTASDRQPARTSPNTYRKTRSRTPGC